MAEVGDNFEMDNLGADKDDATGPALIPPKGSVTDDIYIDDSFNAEHLSLLRPHSPPIPPYIHTPREIDYHDEGEQAKISLGKRAINKIRSLFQSSKFREIDSVELEDSSLWARVKGSRKYIEIKDKFGKFKTDLPKELRKKLGESFSTKLQRNKWANDEATRLQNILRQENEEDQKTYERLHDEEMYDVDFRFERGNEIQKRIVARNEQITRIQNEIDERNRDDMNTIDRLPPRERVRAIFKKYGLTVTSILLAIWAVVSTIIASTQSGVESGGREVNKKTTIPPTRLNKSIPIGAVTDFIFDAALDVIEELVENSFLLIELLVIFYIDKR